jgi:hypothetical protein
VVRSIPNLKNLHVCPADGKTCQFSTVAQNNFVLEIIVVDLEGGRRRRSSRRRSAGCGGENEDSGGMPAFHDPPIDGSKQWYKTQSLLGIISVRSHTHTGTRSVGTSFAILIFGN